jgi:hypothetical protein
MLRVLVLYSSNKLKGDSGGPLNILGNDGRWHFVGITSYG